MDKMIYSVIVEKGEDFGYVIHCPAIPGCHSQGATIEEAVKNIQDAIKGCLSAIDDELIVTGERVGAMEVEV